MEKSAGSMNSYRIRERDYSIGSSFYIEGEHGEHKSKERFRAVDTGAVV